MFCIMIFFNVLIFVKYVVQYIFAFFKLMNVKDVQQNKLQQEMCAITAN